jgi:hypothetical protein
MNIRDAHDKLERAARYVMVTRELSPFKDPPLDAAQAVSILMSLRDLACALTSVLECPRKVN